MPGERPRFGYDRVIDGLLQLIRSQDLQPGARLPTLDDIQHRFVVSSTTARRAVDELRRCGVVGTRQGSGLFVVDPAAAAELDRGVDDDELADLRETVRDLSERLAKVEQQVQRLAGLD